jgi:hypothetical protein
MASQGHFAFEPKNHFLGSRSNGRNGEEPSATSARIAFLWPQKLLHVHPYNA